MTWVDHSIPLKDPHEVFCPKILNDLNDQLHQESEDDLLHCNILDIYDVQILDTKYEQVVIDKVVVDQKHLTPNQYHELQNFLAKHEKLFHGSLGVYLHKKVHIDIFPELELVPQSVYCS